MHTVQFQWSFSGGTDVEGFGGAFASPAEAVSRRGGAGGGTDREGKLCFGGTSEHPAAVGGGGGVLDDDADDVGRVDPEADEVEDEVDASAPSDLG